MADPLQALKAKKAEILETAQREAEAVDVDLRELERLQTLADKYGLALAPKGAAGAKSASNGHAPDLLGAPPSSEARYVVAIREADKLVRSRARPVQFTELYEWVVGHGVVLGGKRPESTLSAYLAHDKSTLQSIRKGWYWLKGVPIPKD